MAYIIRRVGKEEEQLVTINDERHLPQILIIIIDEGKYDLRLGV